MLLAHRGPRRSASWGVLTAHPPGCTPRGGRRRSRAAAAPPRGTRPPRAGSAARTSTRRAGRAGPAGPRRARTARSAPPGRRCAGRRRRAPACRGAGVAEDLARAAGLDDPAGVHHHHPVADVSQHRQVVADDHQPDAQLADQLGEQVEDLRLHHHVERGGRLVGDDQPRLAGQRHRDHHALSLPAGQLVRVRRGHDFAADRPAPAGHPPAAAPSRPPAAAREAGSARRSGRRPGGPG